MSKKLVVLYNNYEDVKEHAHRFFDMLGQGDIIEFRHEDKTTVSTEGLEGWHIGVLSIEAQKEYDEAYILHNKKIQKLYDEYGKKRVNDMAELFLDIEPIELEGALDWWKDDSFRVLENPKSRQRTKYVDKLGNYFDEKYSE